MTVARDGRVVVYLGDDERGEFLYKFVSAHPYVPGGPTSTLWTKVSFTWPVSAPTAPANGWR